jgi:[ribosomal protein S5]-alanine N-acetyltransferase
MEDFETARLRARPWRHGDEEAAIAIYSDPEVMHFIGGVRSNTRDAQREWIDRVAAKYTAYAARGLPYGAWAILDKAGGGPIGTALMKPLPDALELDTDQIEIGWHLGRRGWGRGFATEFGIAVRDLAFRSLPALERVHAVIDPGNARSEAVAKRCGLRWIERTERFYGRALEDYVVTRLEWERMVGQRPA